MKVNLRFVIAVFKRIVVIVTQGTAQSSHLKAHRNNGESKLLSSYFIYAELTGVTRFLIKIYTE